ncbi:MAG: transposase [Microcoleus sp. SIO2G3]|nr:transposase [Microcoleus sp. SIO2G3]
MKTLEFKLSATLAQSQTIDLWLEQLKWVWNRGLSLLEEDQQRRWRTKHDKPLPDSIKLKWRDGRFVGCGIRKTRDGYKYCEIRTNRNIEDPKKLFVSGSYYAKKNNQNNPWLMGICTRAMCGVHQSLDKAWKTYNDPKHPGRRPQYKGKRDNLKTLINNNGKTTVKFTRIANSDNAYAQFPVLGKITCKGFYKRFPAGMEHGAVKIVKEPSGYYLQVCVDLSEPQLKQHDTAVGIDPGLKSVLTTDQGREVAPPKLYRSQLHKLRRLQRKVARQHKGSASQKQTYQKIARQHEKIRRSRNAFNHKLSTKIVREYGAVAMEDLQIKNLVRRPKPKKREDGKGYEKSGAKRKAGLNKSFADSALGDLIAKIESKCKAQGREFVKVPAHYTTIDCSQCGTQIKKSLSVRTHRCSCGYIAGRDENAACNILLKGRKLFERIYRSWEWEVKPLKDGETPSVQAEAALAAPIPEHGFQSPRGEVDAFLPSALQTSPNPHISTLLDDATPPPTRAPSPKKTRKKASAQAEEKKHTQLTLWDWAEAMKEGGGR